MKNIEELIDIVKYISKMYQEMHLSQCEVIIINAILQAHTNHCIEAEFFIEKEVVD